jgi:DNA-binding CsgD family transcriptional regulator/PAS domain-containing protein
VGHPPKLLRFACLEDWRVRVNAQGLSVLGAEAAMSVLPIRGHAPLLTRCPEDNSPEYLWPADLASPDFHDRPKGLACLVATTGEGEAAWIGFSAESRNGEAKSFERRAQPLLDMVNPAYRSAVSAVERLSDHAFALGRILDHLEEPLMVVDPCGRIQHLNRALCRLLDREPQRIGILESMRRAALDLLERPGTPNTPAPGAEGRGRYRISAIFADPSLGNGAPLILVRLETLEAGVLDADALKRRFGLTARQVEVAGLLLEGATAKRVAAVLGVRTNTARNHIQTVLRRLGISSKAELPARLMSLDGSTAPPRPGP